MKKSIIFLGLVLIAVYGFATIINVPADQPTIQAGINIAVEGDTVLVALGTYMENIIWPAVNGIKLIGSGEEDCIIDGDSLLSVIRFEDDLGEIIDTTTLITSFTIQNGYADYGGGIYCGYSSPSLENITITGNSAGSGGGIRCRWNSSPSISNVTITGNSANNGGGGISCYHSSPSLENVTITNNSDSLRGGGICCCYHSNLSLFNVTIMGNSADYSGGGIYCNDSSPSLENITISGNSADYSGGGIYFSGLYGYCSPSLENVTITGNSASVYGGGIYCKDSSPSFSSENRCNIYSNTTENNRGYGIDVFSIYCDAIDVILDTFTVMTPTDYYASPIDSLNFDILHSIQDNLINSDVYVAVDGDNSNTGTSPDEPFKTIKHALSVIYSDSLNNNTIHLASGVYSAPTNGETFPVVWNNYVSLCGSGENETILDANQTSQVMKFRHITEALIQNITLTNGSAVSGGGIYCGTSSPSLENITISGNSADYSGGGIYCNDSSPSLENVAITDNSASVYGGGIYCSWNSNHPILINCILWNDSPEEVYFSEGGEPHTITISYSDIEGGEAGIVTNNNGTVNWLEGNIDEDPLFVDPNNGDYHLIEDSPCVDAGDPNSPLDPDGTIADIGALYFDQLPYIPNADFTSNVTSGIKPLTIDFIDTSTIGSSGTAIDAWNWDFDNNGTIDSQVQNPQWTYTESGLYTVSLTVSDGSYTDTETKVDYITVLEPIIADFEANPTSGLLPLEVQFTDLSVENDNSRDIVSWEWDFDNDGVVDSYEQNPTYTYYYPGCYSVSLTVTNNNNNSDTITKVDYIVVDIVIEFSYQTDGVIESGISLLSEDVLYCAASGDCVYRFNNSGQIEYTLNVNGDIKSATTITPDHNVYIASTDYNLYSFNSNGVSNAGWPLSLGAEATASVASDSVGNIYIGTQNGIFQAVAPDGVNIWSYNVGAPVNSSAVISSDNTLYVINANGRLYAFDLNTINPGNVVYKWRIETNGAVSSTPALDDINNIYIANEEGQLIKINDDGINGNVVWTFESGSAIIESSPLIDNNYNVYFGCSNGRVYSVNDSGQLNWMSDEYDQIKSTGALFESDEIQSRIYIGSDNGKLYALSTDDGSILWEYTSDSAIICPILYNAGKIYFGTVNGEILVINEPDISRGTISRNMAVWSTFQGNNLRTGNQSDNMVSVDPDTVAFKTVVSKNDMAVSGDFWLDVQMQITAGTSPRTLNSLTADVYFGDEISYASADNWAYSFLDGYSRIANDLTTYIRVGTTGNNVNANGDGTPAGWNVTTSWQTVVTLKFTITTATSVNISINDATNDAAYFNNIANNPTGAVTDWTVTNEDGGDITLPVELSSFTAQFIGSSPILCWTTQSETGNAGWNVYRGDYRDAFINGDAIQINPELIEGAGTTSIPTNYTFEDQYNVIAGIEYWYILESVDYSGETFIHGSVSLIIPEEGTTPELPQITVLKGNYPNPFNPNTTISFMVKENETAHLSVFNIKGQKVENIRFEAGIYNYLWDASSYASGIYLYKLKSESFSEIRKMILMK